MLSFQRSVGIVCFCLFGWAGGESLRGDEDSFDAMTVRGEVVTADGKPAEGAVVSTVYTPHDENLISGPIVVLRTTTGAGGAFQIDSLPLSAHLSLYVQHPGSALQMRHLIFTEPVQTAPLRIVVEPVRKLTLHVSDESGKPVKDAYPKQMTWQGKGEEGVLEAYQAEKIGIRIPRSDSEGNLEIGFLPAARDVQGSVWHADFSRTGFEIAKPQETHEVCMRSGEKFTLKFVGKGVEVPREGLELRMSAPGERSRFFSDEPLSLDEKNEFHTTLAAGKYVFLVRKPEVQTLPGLVSEHEVVSGKSSVVEIALTPRGVVTGRVVEINTGKPVANQMILAYSHLPGDSRDEYGLGPGWYFSARAFTDGEGNYRITPGTGDARLEIRSRTHLVEESFASVTGVEKSLEIVAPEMRLRAYPMLKGMIVDPDGKPVSTGVVLQTGAGILGLAQGCDAEGKFEFRIERSSQMKESHGTVSVEVNACDALRPLGIKQNIVLNLRKENKEVLLKLEPIEVESFSPATSNQLPAESLVGKTAPEPVVQKVFHANGVSPRLADHRGKYVLLHFWATWCGPCKQAMPQVELAARLFENQGLVVIGIHHNSVPAEMVERFLEKKGPQHLTLLDSLEGTTCKEYQVDSFPTYVLIGPDGTVLRDSLADREAFWSGLIPMLRSCLASHPVAEELRSR